MAKQKVEEKWVLMTELNGEPLLHHFKLSNLGNVVKIKKGIGAETPFSPKNIGGYKYISFTTRNGSRETIYLHRLVAEFFVPADDENDVFVLHKDYDRENNHFSNLEWVTSQEFYKHRAAKAGRKPKTAKTDTYEENLPEQAERKKAKLRRYVAEFSGI
ncbi:HNH endonuclease [Cryomorpha ignava]|uniref:HNH endonuclease n=1 Tax=Cryomorpha ignava TaxID=101383 RepID=A0A7K3WR07_9FLAO|nr:HNH endonuclease [Cryomorpha ignava]NEN24110.1 HNH endonuclease [Cryomorpha ignava]